MPGQRAPGKAFIGWWAPVELRKRLKAITKSREDVTDTDVLNEALSTYLDQHENGEDPE